MNSIYYIPCVALARKASELIHSPMTYSCRVVPKQERDLATFLTKTRNFKIARFQVILVDVVTT